MEHLGNKIRQKQVLLKPMKRTQCCTCSVKNQAFLRKAKTIRHRRFVFVKLEDVFIIAYYLAAFAWCHPVMVARGLISAYFTWDKRLGVWRTVGIGRHIVLFCNINIRVRKGAAIRSYQPRTRYSVPLDVNKHDTWEYGKVTVVVLLSGILNVC